MADPNERESSVEESGEANGNNDAEQPEQRVQVQGLPTDWTQMGQAPQSVQLRYPTDVMDILPEDTDIVIVGTAGQKITKIGDDFSSTIEADPTRVTQLVLRSHLIRTMEGIGGFRNLELLELYDNQVEALDCLGDGENGAPGATLRTLDMSYNVIRDMRPVELCPNLQELYLANNKLKTMDGLQCLTKLRKIDLGANRIRVMDSEQLAPLVELEELWLGKNKIEEIGGLATLTKLRRLDVQSNRLTKVENLSAVCDTLEELYLSSNGIDSEGAVLSTGLAEEFKVLNVLDLSKNKLTNANEFGHLQALEELWISSNEISDFDSIQNLSSLTNLETIYLEYNPVQKAEPLYRKKLAELIPCLTQIDANMIQTTSSVGVGGGEVKSEEERVKQLRDAIVARAGAESAGK